jgi:inner membrane transporter RhtA
MSQQTLNVPLASWPRPTALMLPPAPWKDGHTQPAALSRAFGRVPPTVLLLLSILSIQLSSALATTLFADLGPAGTAFLSTAFATVVLALLSWPKFDRRIRERAGLILLFGLADAAMVLPFFLALQYIPLGIASAIAFLGPLGLAVATSRRPLHFLCIAIAALGIGLLTPEIGGNLDPRGLGLAALGALGWAAFVLLSKKMGGIFDGHDGLTFALGAASLMLLPFALAEGIMVHGRALEIGGALVVALLNAALPLVLEFRALQRMSARTYGVLVTLEPAIGALVGALLLGQAIGLSMSAAIACVTVAALGITLLDWQSGR